jgi:hypothetical protein
MIMVVDVLLGDLLVFEGQRRPEALRDAEAAYRDAIGRGRLSTPGDAEEWSNVVSAGGGSGRRVLEGRAWLGLAEVHVEQAKEGASDSRLRRLNEAMAAYRQAVELMSLQDRDRFVRSYMRLLEGLERIVGEISRDIESLRREPKPEDR